MVGQTTYLIGSPWFSDLNMTVNVNSTLRIQVATGELNETQSDAGFGQESFYVQSVNINGAAWEKNWFEHEDLMVNGGTIEFELGSKPVVWETGDVPPSPGHVVL
jgi:putative alpha-1,2-mannosidase